MLENFTNCQITNLRLLAAKDLMDGKLMVLNIMLDKSLHTIKILLYMLCGQMILHWKQLLLNLIQMVVQEI